MSEKKKVSAEALCPFYTGESRQKIYCEGVNRQSTLHVAFGSSTECERYKIDNCRRGYKNCRISSMLYQKYGQ